MGRHPPPTFGQCPKENVFFSLRSSLTQRKDFFRKWARAWTLSPTKMDFFWKFSKLPLTALQSKLWKFIGISDNVIEVYHITQVSSLSDQKLKFAVKSPVYSVFQYILHQLLSYSHLWKDRRIKIDISDSHSGLLSPVHPFQHR